MAPRSVLLAILVTTVLAAPASGALAVPSAIGPASDRPGAVADAAPTGGGPGSAAAAPPDPTDDVLGWENGYWYNESIAVDQADDDQLNATELDAFLARTMARVERLRGLEFTATPDVRFVARSTFRERVGIESHTEFSTSTNDQVWEAAFVFGEDEDAFERIRLNGANGALAYAAEDGADGIVVITATEETRVVSPGVLAHELVHVLQDQQFDLSEEQYWPTTNDGEIAKDGLVEGEAAYVDYLYDQRCGADWDCVATPDGWHGATGWNGVYPWITYLPYADGATMVRELVARDGWAAVDAAHEDLPESSEQVIHPDARDDPPEPIDFEDRSTDDWTPGTTEVVGEATIFGLFFGQSRTAAPENRTLDPRAVQRRQSPWDPLNYSAAPSAGWGNDRLVVYEDGDRRGYVWQTVWDTERDAREFHEAYRQVLHSHDAERVGQRTWRVRDPAFADAFHVVRDGRTVTVVNAPTVDDLSGVRRDIEIQPLSVTGTTTAESTTPVEDARATTTAEGDDEVATTAEASDDSDDWSIGPSPVVALLAAVVVIAGAGALLVVRR